MKQNLIKKREELKKRIEQENNELKKLVQLIDQHQKNAQQKQLRIIELQGRFTQLSELISENE